MTMSTNFGAAAADYAKFRAGFPDSLFDRLSGFGVGLRGQAIVDLGTGTGTLARGFARQGARVTGVDPDSRMLEQARQLAQSEDVSVDWRVGKAEAIPLGDGTMDILSAGQCWHWFDGAQAAREFARVARPDGRIVIAHFNWLPLPGSMVLATERLIETHNPSWPYGGSIGIHTQSLAPLAAVGFKVDELFAYDVDVPYTPEAWRGRIRASAGVGASMTPEGVASFDTALARLLETEFPGDVLTAPHRVFAIIYSRSGRGDSTS